MYIYTIASPPTHLKKRVSNAASNHHFSLCSRCFQLHKNCALSILVRTFAAYVSLFQNWFFWLLHCVFTGGISWFLFEFVIKGMSVSTDNLSNCSNLLGRPTDFCPVTYIHNGFLNASVAVDLVMMTSVYHTEIQRSRHGWNSIFNFAAARQSSIFNVATALIKQCKPNVISSSTPHPLPICIHKARIEVPGGSGELPALRLWYTHATYEIVWHDMIWYDTIWSMIWNAYIHIYI